MQTILTRLFAVSVISSYFILSFWNLKIISRCLSQFGMLQQHILVWVAQQQMHMGHGSGGWEEQCQCVVRFSSWLSDCGPVVASHGREGSSGLFSSPYHSTNPLVGCPLSRPHLTLMNSHRPKLLKPSHQGSNMSIWGFHKYPFHNTK